MGEDQPRPISRLTVAQAADQLGISEDAVRSRIKRGTLRSERVDGAVVVLLGADRRTTGEPTDQRSATTDPRDELIAVLREQLAAEREARRRADTIIAQLSQATEEQARTIRELEAPPVTPQEAESASEPAGGVGGQDAPSWPETETSQGSGEPGRPWWRRLFGRW